MRFSQDSEGSTAGRLLWYYGKKGRMKMLYKNSTQENSKNRKRANPHQSTDLLKTTRSKRHSNYYGFKKSRSRKAPVRPEILMHVLTIRRHLVDFGSHFGTHWILKWVTKSTVFEPFKKTNKMRKTRSKKRVGKYVIC